MEVAGEGREEGGSTERRPPPAKAKAVPPLKPPFLSPIPLTRSPALRRGGFEVADGRVIQRAIRVRGSFYNLQAPYDRIYDDCLSSLNAGRGCQLRPLAPPPVAGMRDSESGRVARKEATSKENHRARARPRARASADGGLLSVPGRRRAAVAGKFLLLLLLSPADGATLAPRPRHAPPEALPDVLARAVACGEH